MFKILSFLLCFNLFNLQLQAGTGFSKQAKPLPIGQKALDQRLLEVADEVFTGTPTQIEFKKSEQIKEAQRLIEAGADINAIDEDLRNTPLIKACNAGNMKLVSLLLAQEGLDVNYANLYGYTALMRGHTGTAQLLLSQTKYYIDVNLVNGMDKTALRIAFDHGTSDRLALLLEHKDLDITIPGNDIDELVVLARKRGAFDMERIIKEKAPAIKARAIENVRWQDRSLWIAAVDAYSRLGDVVDESFVLSHPKLRKTSAT